MKTHGFLTIALFTAFFASALSGWAEDAFGNGDVIQPTTASGGTGTVVDLETDDDTYYSVARSQTLTVGGFGAYNDPITSVYLFVQYSVRSEYNGTNAVRVNGVDTTIVPAARDYGRWGYMEITGGAFNIDTSAKISNLLVTFNNNSSTGSNRAVLFDCVFVVVNPTSPIPIHPTWIEDFNGTGAADPLVWNYEVGYKRNNEDQYYMSGTSNGWREGGNFVIEARKEVVNGYQYTSASIVTTNKYYWKYGRAQIRAKIPALPGMWPAIWGTGETGQWPHNGEVDIMEYYDNKILANCAVGTTQQGTAKWDSSNRSMGSLTSVDPNWKNQWHIWTMQWDDQNVRLYCDNILMNTIPQTWLKNTDGYNTSWGPQYPFITNGMSCWLNLAVGGNSGGDPTATMNSGPQRYFIDYWKIWEGATINAAPTNIAMSNSRVLEGQPIGTVVGDLAASDADPGEVHRYSLVSGTGSTHNNQFTIPEFVSDNTLKGVLRTAAVLNRADGATRSIRVRVTDIMGATYDKVLTINIDNSVYSGTWIVNGDDNWTDSAKWLDGKIANGADSTANFTAELTPARVVTLNGNRTIGNIVFTDGTTSSHNLSLSGNTLTLAVATGSPTIDVTQSGRTLTIGSAISGSHGLARTGAGALAISGNNSGLSGGVSSSGTGVLTLQHVNAAGTGTISLASTQTSTPNTFTISGDINVANPIVIDAATGRNSIASTSGNNTLSGNITIENTSSHIILFNNAAALGTTFTVGGAAPDSTTITAATYAGTISFRAGTEGASGILNSRINAPNANFNGNNNGLWTVNSTGNSWAATSLSSTSRFKLGAHDALATGARIELNGSGFVDLNGFNQTIAGLAGSNSSGRITNNSATTDSMLTLTGLAADRNFIGTITNGSEGRKVSLAMDSSGRTQTLTGNNTYTGTTTVSAGTLMLGDGTGNTGNLGGTSAISVALNATLAVNRTGATTQFTDMNAKLITGAGSFLQAGSGTTTLGYLNTYTGTTTISNGTLSINTIKDVSAGSSAIGAPTTAANGVMMIGSAGNTGTLAYTGTGHSSDRQIRIGTNSTAPVVGDTGGATITANGASNAALTFSAANFNTQTDATTGVGADRVLTLQGTSTGANTISGIIQDNLVSGTATGTAKVGVTKAQAGTWILAGTNTYTGTTAVSGGTLVITGATQATSAITFGGGVLGLDTASSVTAASATVDFTGQQVLVTGTTGSPSYTLLTASSITGTPTLAPGSVSGYTLQVSGNQLLLVQSGGGSAYDTWKAANAPGSNPDDDTDGDGVSNAVEFVLGGTSLTKDLDKLPVPDASGSNLTFIFERAQSSIDPKTAVFIETSTDLATWNTAPSPYTAPDGETAGPPVTVVKGVPANFDTVTLTVAKAPDAKKFARLKVVITP